MPRAAALAFKPPLILAPMAGITDRDFRMVVRRIGGCGLVSMEFISSEGLTRQHPRTLQALYFAEAERPIAVQIYGADPERMAASARIVEELGADICDINMGCPANRVVRGAAGAALAADLERARTVVRAVRRTIRCPLTAKFRLGLSDNAHNYLELGRLCQDEGVDAVTLHPRTARQQYTGNAEWEHIARLKASLTIPVFGNGDVTRPEDAQRMIAETDCDAVMIGRASLINPWIFLQSAALLAGKPILEPSLQQRHQLMSRHFEEVIARDDERTALHKLRRFTGWYTHGIPDGRQLRRQLSELLSAAEVLGAVHTFFRERSAA